jgi:beta-glucosidase
MARQSIVLLKNASNTLPLKKNLKRIAVIGPNADNPIAVLGNYNGTPSRVVTLLEGIREKLGPSVEIVYEKAINFTNDTLLLYKDYSAFYKMDRANGVKAEYYNNEDLEGQPVVTRMEKDIDHLWAEGELPAAGMKPSHFSARYSTVFTAPADELLTFEVSADDGYRMYVDDSLYINAWLRNRWGPRQLKLQVKKGKQYRLRLEYHQSVGSASVRLKPGEYVKTNFAGLAQRLGDVDAIIFAGGISPQLEGEEMPVNAPGFNGGDRTSIQLPAVQTNLLRALHQTGKPVIFVMMTGSAIAIPWEAENLPAIVNSWYGGQSAGTAIADVLFGDYNPAGRLPVTFYKSDADLPDFMSYDMRNRTYRYFKGQALYPFGYGLSYSRFHYSDIKVANSLKADQPLPVSVWVENKSERDGDEVVQLYISYPDYKGRAPLRALKGFQRIHLKAGERRQIQFTLMPDDLELVDEATGRRFVPKERIRISLGGGQPDQAIAGSSNIVTTYTKIN